VPSTNISPQFIGITWIIIFLIILSILVTIAEVLLRFGLLAKSGHEGKSVAAPLLLEIAAPTQAALAGMLSDL